jgi:hypothetical protein
MPPLNSNVNRWASAIEAIRRSASVNQESFSTCAHGKDVRPTTSLIAALSASLSSRSRMFELPLDHDELSTDCKVVVLLDGESKYIEPHVAGGDKGTNSLNNFRPVRLDQSALRLEHLDDSDLQRAKAKFTSVVLARHEPDTADWSRCTTGNGVELNAGNLRGEPEIVDGGCTSWATTRPRDFLRYL